MTEKEDISDLLFTLINVLDQHGLQPDDTEFAHKLAVIIKQHIEICDIKLKDS